MPIPLHIARSRPTKAHLLLAAGETSTERVSSDAASLAFDEARALLAMQTPVPRLVADIIHQNTKVLQHQQAGVQHANPIVMLLSFKKTRVHRH